MKPKYNYRKLMSEKNFLQVQKRANNIGKVDMTNVLYNNREIIFTVPSESGNGSYAVHVRFEDLDRRKTRSMTPADINDVIRNSDLRVKCNCPAYKFWGFKYISTEAGYGLSVESRNPEIRNPDKRGYVCKHIYRALQVTPFMTNSIRTKLT